MMVMRLKPGVFGIISAQIPLLRPSATQLTLHGVLFVVLCLFCSVETARASAATDRREPGQLPVEIAIFIIDVDAIDTANQSFDANVFIEARWHDPGLAHDRIRPLVKPLGEVWHPRLQIVNQQKVIETFPKEVEVGRDGTVTYRQRIWGSFSQPLHLKDFPFDHQSFTIQVVATGYHPGQLVLVPDQDRKTGIAEEVSQTEWQILSWHADSGIYQPLPGRSGMPAFALTFEAKRKQNYYVVKVILPLVLIVMMSWVVFWIDLAETGTDIGVVMTSMLTLIAYRFALGTFLPLISYLTRLDFFVLCSTLLVFLSLVEVTTTSILVERGRKDLAVSVDRACRWVFPAIFLYLACQTLYFPLPGLG